VLTVGSVLTLGCSITPPSRRASAAAPAARHGVDTSYSQLHGLSYYQTLLWGCNRMEQKAYRESG
jgi:hypothetical protein